MRPSLSMQGRMSRAGYFWRGLAAAALFYTGIFVSAALSPETVANEDMLLSFWVMTGIVTLYSGVNTVKRLHDLDKPGWHYWLQLVPIYSLYLSLVLILKPGTPGPNYYGDNPVTSADKTLNASPAV